MKYLLLIPFSVLLGLVAGSWAPKLELTKTRQELIELKKELGTRNQGSKLSVLGNIIKIPEKKSRQKPDHTTATTNAPILSSEGVTNLSDSAVSTNAIAEKRSEKRRRFPDPKSENYEENLEEAKELWATRVEIARSQWQAKLKLNDEEIELFDKAISDMNDKLYLTMQAVAEELQTEESMSTESGLRIMNAVTATMVETYDKIGEAVPSEKRSEIERIEMQDFIDPSAFDPLIDVKDNINGVR